MIKLAFKLVSFFWILAPVGFLVGRALGIWKFSNDAAIFCLLMAGCFVALFLNYNPEE